MNFNQIDNKLEIINDVKINVNQMNLNKSK